jgi:hypothetical protein
MSAFRIQLHRLRSLFVFVIVISLASGFGGATRGQAALAGPLPGCIQPPDGLTAWWPLDKQAGTTTEELMQGWDGNSLGAPILVPARVGMGFQFDGVDDYVSTPLTSIFEPAITIDAWVWVDNFTTSQMDIVSIDQDWLGIAKNGDSYYFTAHIIDITAGEITVVGSTPVQPHTWYHVAMRTDDDQELRLLVNGEQVDSAGISGSPMPPSGNFLIGTGNSGGGLTHFFDGIIDEVEIFYRALSNSEIQAIYAAGPAGKCKCLAPAPGLVSWWPGDGNSKDIVGKNHGTLINSASYVNDGLVGPAFNFGGSGFVEVPDSSSLNSASALTLNTWVRVSNLPVTFMDIIGKDTEGVGGARSYLLNVARVGGQVYFRAHLTTTNSGFKYITGSTSVTVGTWYHIAMTYDGAALRLFVNGIEDASTPVTGMIVSNDGPFRIGGGAPPGQAQYFFDGWIDEVQLHDVALSASDIQAIYEYGVLGQCKHCQIYLPLVRRQ